MKIRIKEFAKLTNVSVRTLHYYDEIGLLEPCSDGQFMRNIEKHIKRIEHTVIYCTNEHILSKAQVIIEDLLMITCALSYYFIELYVPILFTSNVNIHAYSICFKTRDHVCIYMI